MSGLKADRSPEQDTDLERRVLAHERILQSLIACMARTEPRFVEHLRERFVDPMALARREHDHRDVHDYAEEFVRAVITLGEAAGKPTAAAQNAAPAAANAPGAAPPNPPPGADPGPEDDPRVTLKRRNGVWQVRCEGKFWGDYFQRDHALAAMAVAKLSLV